MPSKIAPDYTLQYLRCRIIFGIVLICSVVWHSPVFSQQKPGKRQILAWAKTADSLYNLDNPTDYSDDKALKLFTLIAKLDTVAGNDVRIQSLIKAGNIKQGQQKYALANQYYHRALQYNKPVKPNLAYETYLYLGSSMYFNRVVDSAQYYWEKASNLSEEFRNRYKLEEQDRLYNSLGAIYFEAANYQQAIYYFRTALRLHSPGKDEYQEIYTTIQSNLAQCLLKLNNVDSSLRILKSLSATSSQKEIIQQNIGHAYYVKGVYDSALKIYTGLKITNSHHRVLALNDLGRIYLKKGMFRQSSLMFDSAIAVNVKMSGKLKNKDKALSYLSKAELSEKLNQLDSAILWCTRALEEIHFTYKSKNTFDYPEDISKTVSPIVFYQVLNYKAELLFKKFSLNKNEELLKAALGTVVKAVESANFISKNLDNDDAKLFFIENAQKYYELGVKIAYEAGKRHPENYQELIFILEGYKGNILRQNLEFSRSKLNSGIPDSLTQREIDLKGLYAVYLSKLNQASNESESGSIQRKLDSLQVSLSRLQKSYEKYELFTWLKNSQTDRRITLQEIREKLDRRTALINFFVGTNEIYALAITRDKLEVSKVPIDPAFIATIKNYVDQCYMLSEGVRYRGYSASSQIFNKLFEPFYHMIAKYERLVIIPDKMLFQVPLDGLIISNGTREYLVRRHTISYHYSFSLLLQGIASQDRQLPGSQEILAFAPFSEELKNFGANANFFLPFSGQEIDRDYAKKFFSSSATKEQFLHAYKQNDILHLATHASLGNDSSSNWIQFFPKQDTYDPDRLYIHEIYNLHLKKNGLVILSACESGAGLAVSGEGLLSLSRAFMYAGAGGIVSTLYKTDDRVTAFIMKRFYEHMDKGLDPSEALQRSKIDLLETNELNPRLKTPNYWSNFIYLGKIKPRENFSLGWLFPIILMVFIVFFLLKRKLKAKPGNNQD